MLNFRTKIDAAENQAYVDIAFWGGVVPDNADQLKGKCQLGNCSIKKEASMVSKLLACSIKHYFVNLNNTCNGWIMGRTSSAPNSARRLFVDKVQGL